MTWLLTPPLAFLAYLLLVGFLSGIGRVMAGEELEVGRTQGVDVASRGGAPAHPELRGGEVGRAHA